MSAKRVVVREASGLVRQINWVDNMLIGLACISIGPGFMWVFTWMPAFWPSGNLFLSLTLGAIGCSFQGIMYVLMGTAMPRSGGDYTFISRIYKPWLGFMENWTLIIYACLVIGTVAPMMSNLVLFGGFWSWGVMTGNSALIGTAKWLLTPLPCFLITMATYVPAMLIMIFSLKATLKIFQAATVIGMISWGIVTVIFAVSSREAFVSAFNSNLSPLGVTYQGVIDVARASGQMASTDFWKVASDTLGGMFYTFFMYYGYYIGAFYAGELKEAGKSLLYGTMGALWWAWAAYVIPLPFIAKTIGLDFMSYAGYMFYFNPTGWAANIPPYPQFFASLLYPNPILAFIMWFGTGAWVISLELSYWMFISRCMFAWSFDRIMPEKLAYVSPKYHTPVVTIIISTLISIVGVYLSLYTGALVFSNMAINMSFCWLIATIVAIAFPKLKPEIYKAAPRVVTWKIGSIPGISILGSITSGILIFVIWGAIQYPGVGGYVSWKTFAFVLFLFFAGGIVYLISKYVRKRQGIDIELAFSEIPPE